MASLRECWDTAEGGRGRAALLVADAGVGKSRMIPAFKEGLADRPLRLHEAWCSPFFVNSAWHSVVEMLRVEMNIGRDDSGDVALGKLRIWLTEQPPTPSDAVPLLAGLLDIPPEAGYEALDLSPPGSQAPHGPRSCSPACYRPRAGRPRSSWWRICTGSIPPPSICWGSCWLACPSTGPWC